MEKDGYMRGRWRALGVIGGRSKGGKQLDVALYVYPSDRYILVSHVSFSIRFSRFRHTAAWRRFAHFRHILNSSMSHIYNSGHGLELGHAFKIFLL
jgi:hypothetical protein